MQLSFLEFGNVSEVKVNAHKIIENLFEFSAALDKMNAKRLWLGEHYGIDQRVSWFSPRQLLPLLLANTESLVIGSGGELINYHSPLHIAHDYILLSALFGDRVDLGMAKGTRLPAEVEDGVGYTVENWMESFHDKIEKVYSIIYEEDKRALTMPLEGVQTPNLWFLGPRRHDYPKIIDVKGNLALSLHHDNKLIEDPRVLLDYRDQFYERHGYYPQVLVSVACYCVDSESEKNMILKRLESSYMRNSIQVGALVDYAENIYERLVEISKIFGIDEVMIHNDSREIEEKNKVLRIFECCYNDQQKDLSENISVAI